MSQQASSSPVATDSIYDNLQDRSSAASLLSFSHLHTAAMKFFVLSLFLGSVTATPLEYLQEIISESHSENGAVEGWYDPRDSGGRFLDVNTPSYRQHPIYPYIFPSSPPRPKGNHSTSSSLVYRTPTS